MTRFYNSRPDLAPAVQIIRNKAEKGKLPTEAEYLASAHQRAREKQILRDDLDAFV